MALAITDILRSEHQQVAALFEKLHSNSIENENATDTQRPIFDELKILMTIHSRCEEDVLYPQLEALKDLHHFAEECFHDHNEMDEFIDELDSLSLSDDRWIEISTRLFQLFHDHVQLEERQIFPLLESYFLSEELELMGEDYVHVRYSIERTDSLRATVRGFTKAFQKQVGRFFGAQL
jgi:hemerythrin superfamily protein